MGWISPASGATTRGPDVTCRTQPIGLRRAHDLALGAASRVVSRRLRTAAFLRCGASSSARFFTASATWLAIPATHLLVPPASKVTIHNNRCGGASAFGEGWHNNHHAHPVSAPRAGLGELESWMASAFWRMLGLVWA